MPARLKVLIKLGVKLNLVPYDVQLVDDFDTALRAAARVVEDVDHKLQPKLDAFEGPVEGEWSLSDDTFSIQFSTVEDRILKVVVAGTPEERHLDEIFSLQERIIRKTVLGRVSIQTRFEAVDRKDGADGEIVSGDRAVLQVVDNGGGISPQDMERIFEPFYTKKVLGRSGTGLGLTVVWNTVQDHGGFMEVTSVSGRTCFELMLRIRPEQQALITSGYSATEKVQRALTLGSGPFVAKPYSLKSLGTAVRNGLAMSG